MKWIVVALIAVAALSLLRIFSQVRRATRKTENDWDARFIAQLRKAGIAPFDPQSVDFFFALPTQAACDAIAATLEPDAYVVDSRAEPEGGFSLHANRNMRLIVPDMQALTARFKALAEEHGGKYDGWAVAKGPRVRGR
jgi:regulator of ribonuclease activity B